MGLRFVIFDLSVWASLVFWVTLQLFGLFLQANRGAPVSYAAHVGGALTGLIFWALCGRNEAGVLQRATDGGLSS